MYCDAHTHLNDDTLYADWRTHLDSFGAAGGELLINIGINQSRNQMGIDVARQAADHDVCVYTTVGIHPCEIASKALTLIDLENEMAHLETLLTTHPDLIVAIGETGTDAHYDPGDTMETQHAYFRAQCELAQRYDLPVVVHSRDDFGSVAQIINEYPAVRFYIHSWTYGPDQLSQLLHQHDDCSIGYNGIVTFKNAKDIHASMLACPIELLVCETDAPYLAPTPHR